MRTHRSISFCRAMSDEWWAYELHMWIHLPRVRVCVMKCWCHNRRLRHHHTFQSIVNRWNCQLINAREWERERDRETTCLFVLRKKASIWILVITAHHLAASPPRKVNELKIGFLFLFIFFIFLSPFSLRNILSEKLNEFIASQNPHSIDSTTHGPGEQIRDHMIMELKPAKWINLSLFVCLRLFFSAAPSLATSRSPSSNHYSFANRMR